MGHISCFFTCPTFFIIYWTLWIIHDRDVELFYLLWWLMLLSLAGVLRGWAHSPILSTFQQMAAKISTQFFESCSCFFFSGKFGAPHPCEFECKPQISAHDKCRFGGSLLVFPPKGNSLLPLSSSSSTWLLKAASQWLSLEPQTPHTVQKGESLQVKGQTAANHTQLQITPSGEGWTHSFPAFSLSLLPSNSWGF